MKNNIKECNKKKFKFIKIKMIDGFAYKVNQCEECEVKCEELHLPTIQEIREFNG